jgi:Tfp pilus assembly protein PilF
MAEAAGERALLDDLLRTIREEIVAHPTWPDLRHKAAILLLERGEVAAAEVELHAALERNPKYGDAQATLAFARLAAGDAEGAAAAAGRATALRPEDWRLHVSAGLLLLTAGTFAAACMELEEAARLAPDRPLAAFALAHALASPDKTGAAERWRRLEARFPALAARGADPALVGNPARAVVRREAAFYLAQQGDDAAAQAWLDRALALDLDEGVDAAARADLAFAAGDLAAAVEGFRRALAIDPELVKARVSLAYALGVEGDLDGAIAELEGAIKRKPKYADLRYQLATLLLDRGERQKGILQLEAALGVNPGYAAAHYSLGLLFFGDGRWKDARARFESARKGGFAPEEALAYEGLCCIEQGEYQDAKSRFKHVIDEDDDVAAAHLGLAIVRLEEGKAGRARELFERYRALHGPTGEDASASEAERYLARKAAEVERRLATART